MEHKDNHAVEEEKRIAIFKSVEQLDFAIHGQLETWSVRKKKGIRVSAVSWVQGF